MYQTQLSRARKFRRARSETGRRIHDVRSEPVGGWAGPVEPDAPVGKYAGPPRRRRQAAGGWAGEPDRQRQGTFADAEV
jgi:hypothetical protein